jgi:hypothetical protein
MKKVTVAAMAAMVLVTGAMAQDFISGPSGNDLCRLVPAKIFNEFGDKTTKLEPYLYTIGKITNDEASDIIARIVLSSPSLYNNKGCDNACIYLNGVIIDTRLGYQGISGTSLDSKFELRNEIGAAGAVKKIASINLPVLAKQITFYISGNLKRAVLLESYVAATYGGAYLPKINNCSVNDGVMEKFQFSDTGVGVELATLLTKKGGTAREYALLNALLAGSPIDISNVMLSDKRTKAIFDNTMNSITRQKTSDLAAAESLKKIDEEKRIADVKAEEEYQKNLPQLKSELLAMRKNSKILKCLLGPVTYTKAQTVENYRNAPKENNPEIIVNIDGDDYVGYFIGGSYGKFQSKYINPLSACYTAEEDAEYYKNKGDDRKKFEKLHPRWGFVVTSEKPFSWKGGTDVMREYALEKWSPAILYDKFMDRVDEELDK